MDHNSLRTRIATTRSILGEARWALLASLTTTFAFAQEPEPTAPSDRAESGSEAALDEAPAIQPDESPSEGSPIDEETRADVTEDDRPPAESSKEQRPAGSPETLSDASEEEEAQAASDSDEAEANGDQLPPRQSLMPEIHGFVSQGFIKTSQHNYLARSERGSFEFTEVGLNFTKQVSDRLRVGMQLFMRDLGPIGNYKPQFDWFYLDYNFFDWLGLRAGRTKIPFGLYNEVEDVDAARVPVLLPQAVYPTRNRDYLLAQTGLELYGRAPLGVLGDLEYRGYGGTIYFEEDQPLIDAPDIPYVVGGRLMWETPLTGLRAGGTLQALSVDGDYVLPPAAVAGYQEQGILPADSTGRIPFRIPVVMWVASLEYSVHNFQLAAEYSRWYAHLENDYPEIIEPAEVTTEGYYVMASYRVARWFTPGVYYAAYFPDTDNREGRESHWHDVAITTRYDITDNWLFKLEGHYMEGTAGLDTNLNDNIPLAELNSTWGLLLAKTTAYF